MLLPISKLAGVQAKLLPHPRRSGIWRWPRARSWPHQRRHRHRLGSPPINIDQTPPTVTGAKIVAP